MKRRRYPSCSGSTQQPFLRRHMVPPPRHLLPRRLAGLALLAAALALATCMAPAWAGKPRSVKDWAKLKDEDFDAVEGSWREGDDESVRSASCVFMPVV